MTIVDLSEIELSISSEHHHGHAARVLANSPGLEEEVRQVLTGTVGIARTTRRAQAVQREGLTAASLNQGIKEAFTRVGGWSFEAVVREGVVFDWTSPDSKKEGFDIARYDLAANVARAWSLCFGRRALADGAQEWARFQTR
ncbi:MAG: hypothetical protein ACJ77U_00985, partial [Chloroflexota bacterium]